MQSIFILWWNHLCVDVAVVPARYVPNLHRAVWRVVLARAYSGLGLLVFCSSINTFCCCNTCMLNDSQEFLFKVLVNQLNLKYCTIFGMRLIICFWNTQSHISEPTFKYITGNQNFETHYFDAKYRYIRNPFP